MPSSVKANLLDNGVFVTLGSVGAGRAHTFVSIKASDMHAKPIAKLLEKLVNKSA
jgi:hypothetical protein